MSVRSLPYDQEVDRDHEAQDAANFGNEYYDFKNGIDRKGRAGFRRGVTEGEIRPEAMKIATFAALHGSFLKSIRCLVFLILPFAECPQCV